MIAQLHGVQILIESKVGEGTKVSVIFEEKQTDQSINTGQK